jgi:hypothetical protein
MGTKTARTKHTKITEEHEDDRTKAEERGGTTNTGSEHKTL